MPNKWTQKKVASVTAATLAARAVAPCNSIERNCAASVLVTSITPALIPSSSVPNLG